MIVASCKEVTIPLYWELLDNNSGNSNTNDRISLLKQCIKLLGAKRIGLFLGDREFIGHKWLKYLKDKKIHFCVRIPKHHKITQFLEMDGGCEAAEILGNKDEVFLSNSMVDGVWGNVYLKRCSDGEILYLFGTPKTRYLGQLYRKRWKIEMLFQQIKKRGFDLEATHLNEDFKLKKLVGLVSIAYALVTALGIDHHKTVCPIKVKNHGYKENSFARKGIDIVREGLRRTWEKDIFIFQRLIQKFLRWTKINPNRLSYI